MTAMAPDRRTLARRLRAWMRDNSDSLTGFGPSAHSTVLEYFTALRPLHRMLYDAGWSRWGWPVEFGGLGGHPSLRGVVYDEIYGAGLDLPRGFELLEVIGPTVVEHAPGVARRHLPGLLSGADIVCQGFSEPEAGSDLAAVRTRAQRRGGEFRVSGQKLWISHGHAADWCLLLVRTGAADSRHRGLSVLWLDMHAPGVTARPIEFVDGRDELSELFLDDVAIPEENLVGPVDSGWAVAMYLLQFERGNWAWQRHAWLRAKLTEALAEGGEDANSAAGAVGAAWLDLIALRASSRRTLLRLADGERLGQHTSVDKLLMSRAERAVLDAARAISWPATELSGRWEADWFYSRAASVYGGASEVQRDIVAESLLGMRRS